MSEFDSLVQIGPRLEELFSKAEFELLSGPKVERYGSLELVFGRHSRSLERYIIVSFLKVSGTPEFYNEAIFQMEIYVGAQDSSAFTRRLFATSAGNAEVLYQRISDGLFSDAADRAERLVSQDLDQRFTPPRNRYAS